MKASPAFIPSLDLDPPRLDARTTARELDFAPLFLGPLVPTFAVAFLAIPISCSFYDLTHRPRRVSANRRSVQLCERIGVLTL
jgi:hypothetical protein